MRVIVGLGNPGKPYAGTRHNVGFAVIDYLAGAPTVGPFRSQFQAQVAETTEGSEKLLLVKPETFMNLSGRAVRQILDFYKLSPAEMLIVCDDFHLPLGKLRLRAQGSHGGQNGLRNIQEQLGTDAYPRLRIGVGQPTPGEAVDHVLSRFKPAERTVIDEAVANAAAAGLIWVRQGIEACMNRVNGPGESGKENSRPRKEKRDRAPEERSNRPNE